MPKCRVGKPSNKLCRVLQVVPSQSWVILLNIARWTDSFSYRVLLRAVPEVAGEKLTAAPPLRLKNKQTKWIKVKIFIEVGNSPDAAPEAAVLVARSHLSGYESTYSFGLGGFSAPNLDLSLFYTKFLQAIFFPSNIAYSISFCISGANKAQYTHFLLII